MSKIYLMTEEQMGDINYLLCVASKEGDKDVSRLVNKVINRLSWLPYVTPSDDRINGIVGQLMNK